MTPQGHPRQPSPVADPTPHPARPPGWVWAAYAALFAASVPWYVPQGAARIWFGLPHWVVLSLLAMAGVAVFTVFVVRTYWPDDDTDADAGVQPPDEAGR